MPREGEDDATDDRGGDRCPLGDAPSARLALMLMPMLLLRRRRLRGGVAVLIIGVLVVVFVASGLAARSSGSRGRLAEHLDRVARKMVFLFLSFLFFPSVSHPSSP